MPPYYGGYHSTYMDKQKAKGDFKPGDRVRVKSEYQGKTYAARVKRQGDWIVDVFKTANWELKRPDDWTGPSHYPKRLRAKPYQIVMAPPKIEAPPKPKAEDKLLAEPVTHGPHWTEEYNTADVKITQSTQPHWMAQGSSASKKIEELSKPQVDVQVYRPGTVVLIKHPDGKLHKGLHTIIENSNTELTWTAVAPLFGGLAAIVKTAWITVIPEKDLTITYLPQ